MEIVEVTSAGTTQATATEIPHTIPHTVAIVTTTGTDTGVRLPSNAAIGDVVEVARPATHVIKVYPPTGESFIQGTTWDSGVGVIFKKVTGSMWILNT
jgi:hypothetical protein